jgi:hypothetical protein
MHMGNGLGGLVLLLLLVGSGVFVLAYGMRLRARRNERLADLYEKAIENGLDPREIQFSLDEQEQGDPQGNLKAGIILLATALGMVGGIWGAAVLPGPFKLIGFALVPALIGCAALFIHSSVPRPKA